MRRLFKYLLAFAFVALSMLGAVEVFEVEVSLGALLTVLVLGLLAFFGFGA